MTFSRPISMIKFVGNQSSVQSDLYWEADTRYDVTNVYTATCTVAADQHNNLVQWAFNKTVPYRTFLSISVILLIFGLYYNQKN